MDKHKDDILQSDMKGGSELSLPSSPTKPFLFRQVVVRELVVSTKQGIVNLKEVCMSHCESDKGKSFFTKSWKTGSLSVKSPSTSSLQNARGRGRSRPATKKAKVDPERKNHENIRSKTFTEKKVKVLDWKYASIISLLPPLILFSTISLISVYNENNQNISNWNHQSLSETLRQEVFGQDKPIESVLKILDSFLKKDLFIEQPVILLTGSTGVGKSLVSSLIARNFPRPGNADIVLPPLPSPEHLLNKFSTRGFNLVVVDSLSANSIVGASDWIKHLSIEASLQSKQVIVVLVCSLQTAIMGDQNTISASSMQVKAEDIQAKLQSDGFDSHHVHFNSLRKEHVKKCVEVALRKHGLKNDFDIEKYVNIISSDIDVIHEGCKSVWSQTAVFSIS